MEFAGFDDDLFVEKTKQSSSVVEYCARMCDDRWFLTIPREQLVSDEDAMGVLKYSADYLFYSKNYDEAIVKYKHILQLLPQGNTSSRRECWENLVRSHIKRGTGVDAITYAEQLHQSSRTSDQATVSLTAYLDVHLSAKKYSEALKAAMTLVTLHPENSHLWIKLGYVYSCIYQLELPSIKSFVAAHLPACVSSDQKCVEGVSDSFENFKIATDSSEYGTGGEEVPVDKVKLTDMQLVERKPVSSSIDRHTSADCDGGGVRLVATCLLRAFFLLKKTEGTAKGIATTFSQIHQDKLRCALDVLHDKDTSIDLREKMVKNERLPGESSCPATGEEEFVDRGSSKFKSNAKEVHVEFVSQRSFEAKWFK